MYKKFKYCIRKDSEIVQEKRVFDLNGNKIREIIAFLTRTRTNRKHSGTINFTVVDLSYFRFSFSSLEPS